MLLPSTETTPESNVQEMGEQESQIAKMQAIIGVPQTGRYDEATFNALKLWQTSMGLKVTGYPNTETIAALKKMGGEAMADLTWWDWAIIYAFEYRWWVIGAGVGVLGGVGYWLWRRGKKRKS